MIGALVDVHCSVDRFAVWVVGLLTTFQVKSDVSYFQVAADGDFLGSSR